MLKSNKEKNQRKEPQIKSKPAPEKLNPIEALPQKTNSNTALYLGVFVTILIGALILFLMNNNNESSEEYLLADSTAIAAAADSASFQQVTFTSM
jgi:bacteriorhodopsin